MATRRTVTTVEHDLKDGAEAAPEDKTPEERIADEDLTLALAEIGDSEGRVQCKRTAPKDKVGMAGTYAPAEFSIERLRDEWGGGTYELYFRLPNGQLKTKRVVQILDRIAPAAPTDKMAELLAAMQNKGGDHTGLILQLMQAQQKSTTDMIVAMIGAQNRQAPAQGMGPTDVVALLGAIQSLTGKGADKSGSSLDDLVKVLKIAKELGGDGGGDGGWMDKLATVAGPLLEKLAEGKSNAAQAPLARSPVPVSASIVRSTPERPAAPVQGEPAPGGQAVGEGSPGGGTTAEVSAGENMNLRLIGWLRETLKMVLDKAEKDKDPELYADYVLDNLPAGLGVDVILPHLQAEDALDRLAFFDSRATKYRDWLEEFRDALVERIEEAQAELARAENATAAPVPPPEPQPHGADLVGVLNESPNESNDSEG